MQGCLPDVCKFRADVVVGLAAPFAPFGPHTGETGLPLLGPHHPTVCSDASCEGEACTRKGRRPRPPGLTPRKTGCRVAVYHGWDDPFARPEDVVALTGELTDAGGDWQFHAYGRTMHSFMAERADRPEPGIAYKARSAERARSGLRGFLARVPTG
ncbi:dienelactone hydrolase family protein [Streptomyces sp. NPDC056638]|uniref:dienelactone hydrolase family protein n=1 Tax=Streptomyces sp. NPDC056638 TaxID=3345887 RepID=UPI00367AE080